MTWNIHGAYGRNPRFALEAVIALIARHEPDVVALQEIDLRRPRAAGIEEPFRALQSALGGHGIEAKSITTADGAYGQALISRWPVRNPEIHDISYKEREPRRAIRCEVVAPAGTARVIATHLGLSIAERRGQAQALTALIGQAPVTTVVLGDFNDWSGSARSARCSRRICRRAAARAPSRRSAPCFASTGSMAGRVSALVRARTDPAARALSDHLPVIADIALDVG